MGRKRSIPDRVKAGKSRIVPYYSGEGFRTRHARRLSSNLKQEANVRRWCKQRGLMLRITNDGHHWQFTDGYFLAEWWRLQTSAEDRRGFVQAAAVRLAFPG